MRVIFVSATCSPKQYIEICQKRKFSLLDSSQKFFDMFLRGLAEQSDVKVDCLCIPPVSHSTYPGMFIKKRYEKDGNITYHSVGFINYPLLKSLTAQWALKSKLKRIIKSSDEETFLVADPLLLEGAITVIRMAEKYKKTTIGFLTDLPYHADECDKHSFFKRMLYNFYNGKCNQFLKKFSRYIFLTEEMNKVVNKSGKPWLLMECMVDFSNTIQIQNMGTDAIPSVLYAGKLHKEFGMDILLDATALVKHKCLFRIYGDGNYREELEKQAKLQKNICVHGIIPVNEVIKEEMKSTVLLNPRTSQGEFTQYSFPSKTAEYMLAGVPVIMFKLPGIPSEYDEHLYYPENETAQSFAEKIDEVLSLPKDVLEEKGKRAKEFIICEKNNIKQAQRFIKFCTSDGDI